MSWLAFIMQKVPTRIGTTKLRSCSSMSMSMLRARRFSTQLAAPLGDAVLSRLEAACRVSTNGSILDRHGDDESHHPSQPPAVRCFGAWSLDQQITALLRLGLA